MIDEKAEVLICGFTNPLHANTIDFNKYCLLKDSLYEMNKHLEEINYDEIERKVYRFSVLTVDRNGYHDLVYTYTGDKRIKVREKFDGMLRFTSDLKVEIIK